MLKLQLDLVISIHLVIAVVPKDSAVADLPRGHLLESMTEGQTLPRSHFLNFCPLLVAFFNLFVRSRSHF